MREAAEKDPRGRIAGLFLLVLIAAMAMPLALHKLCGFGAGIGSLFGGYGIEAAAIVYICLLRWLLMRFVPIQMLVCLQCKTVKATRWTHEKGLSMDWQLDISPSSVCTKCGYSLLDLEVNRCPECGHPFPHSWLKPHKHTPQEPS